MPKHPKEIYTELMEKIGNLVSEAEDELREVYGNE